MNWRVVMDDVYDYLYKNDDIEPNKLLKDIIKTFNLDVFEARRIYNAWKVEYMRSTFNEN
ncbi:MAG: hypothetical protein J6D47_14460 [Peptostreptococcaceae bacterium]|nr:hypothetical protein [Peptostreptococcaceae bacterium]